MGLLFDDATLAEFKLISESEMPDTVTITNYTITDGALGGRIKSGPVVTVTKGRMQRTGPPNDQVLTLSLPLGVVLTEESTVAVESARTGFSGTYAVESAEMGSFAVHQQFTVRPKDAA